MYRRAITPIVAFTVMVATQAQADDWCENLKLSQAQEAPKPQKIARELLSRQVKLSMEQAEELAQKQAVGKTTQIELELSKDGKLIYEVEIQTRSNEQTEVQIDAVTGTVVKVASEPTKQKQQEQKQRSAKKKVKQP